MKEIKEKLEEYYQHIINIFNQDNDSPKLLHRRHYRFRKKEDEELVTGLVVVFLIIIILISTAYYFMVFAPEQEELSNHKQEMINHVNNVLSEDEEHNRQSIIAQIESKNTIRELDELDVDAMMHPILKNILIQELDEYRDKYDRVEVQTSNTTDIMNTDNATAYINSCDVETLSNIKIKQVDSVIIPLTINRKQAASGFITQKDVVDIYKTNDDNEEYMDYDDNVTENSSASDSTKIVGGSTVVSILRSKDSGSIEENIELSETPKNRNMSQSSSLDLQQIMSSKAAGTYDEKQLKVLLDDYGIRLANYERTSNIGDLDVEYIIMVEVPRDSVESLIENMDNIILTIPTYDAPSWVKL